MAFTPIDMTIVLAPCDYNERLETQHQNLRSAWVSVASVYNNAQGEVSAQTIQNFLSFMRSYSLVHFRAEDAWHKKYNWSNYAKHQKSHGSFTELLLSLIDRVYAEPLTSELVYEVLDSVATWLQAHINGEDTEFYSVLKGIEANSQG